MQYGDSYLVLKDVRRAPPMHSSWGSCLEVSTQDVRPASRSTCPVTSTRVVAVEELKDLEKDVNGHMMTHLCDPDEIVLPCDPDIAG